MRMSPTVNNIILQDYNGNTISILPKDNGTCIVNEAEHESVTWRCSENVEIRHKGQSSEVYYWSSGEGGIVGGGWRVKR